MSTALPLTKPCPPSCVEALPCEVTVFGMGLQGDAGPESPGGPNPTGQDSAFQGVQRGRSGESSAGRGWRERPASTAPPPVPPQGLGANRPAVCARPAAGAWPTQNHAGTLMRLHIRAASASTLVLLPSVLSRTRLQ